jgi:hypothetical protein
MTRRIAVVLSVAALVFALQLLSPANLLAKPEFAARYQTSCWSCHTNPYGGGVRTEEGLGFERTLSLTATQNWLNKKFPGYDFNPIVNKNLQLGADGWLMFFGEQVEGPDSQGKQKTKWQSSYLFMEGNVYADARLLPILHLVAGYDVANNATETFGQIDGLPAGLYFKVGRFIPPFGLRFDDHTVFTRDPLGFSQLAQDSGVEVGVRPGPVYVMAAMTNGNLGATGMDLDKNWYAATVQGGVHFWKFTVGASFFHNTRDDMIREVYGPYLMFGWGPFAYVGEGDLFDQENPAAVNPPFPSKWAHGWTMIHHVDIQIIEGLSLQGRYSYYEPNIKVEKDEYYQVMGGVNVYPIPFFEVNFQYRHNSEQQPSVNNDELLAHAHVFF